MHFPQRRYVWVVDLIGILVGAGLAGHAVATRVAEALAVDAAPPPRRADVAARPPSPPSTAAPAQPMTDVEVLNGIRKLAPCLYEIRRDSLDHAGWISPPGPLILPETRAGKPAGFRIFGIGRQGFPAAVGLASGDLLLEANGVALTGPDAALAAYARFRTTTHAWLLLERAGRPMRIDYVIR